VFLDATTSSRVRRVRHLLAVAGLALAAVGCADSGEPVAAISISLDRGGVPLGAPIELTLEIEALPPITEVQEDHRVLVHFLDANEELMWAEDHDPPTPTSQWQPGTPVRYTRRATVPMYPYIGDVTVAVGLYSPSTGQRLVLTGEDLGQRAYRGTVLNLEPQAESSFLLYEDGWHPEEFDADASAQWRWTSDQASVSFRNPRSDAVLYLQLAGRPDLFDTPQVVSVTTGEETLHEITLDTADEQFLEIDLSAAQLGAGDTVRLDLRVEPSFVPSEIGAGDDDRRLGVRVFYAFLEPVS
jgi:hypothetical protein